MSTVFGRLRGVWRDHIVGPRLRTYEDARADLGGMPWRTAQDTDRWFLVGRPDTLSQKLPSADKLATLDTGSISLKRTMSDNTKLLFLGGSALLVIVLCIISLAGGAHAAPPTAIAMLTPTAASTTAPAIAPASPTAVIVAAPRSSSSVQALFGAHSKPGAKKHFVARRHRR